MPSASSAQFEPIDDVPSHPVSQTSCAMRCVNAWEGAGRRWMIIRGTKAAGCWLTGPVAAVGKATLCCHWQPRQDHASSCRLWAAAYTSGCVTGPGCVGGSFTDAFLVCSLCYLSRLAMFDSGTQRDPEASSS